MENERQRSTNVSCLVLSLHQKRQEGRHTQKQRLSAKRLKKNLPLGDRVHILQPRATTIAQPINSRSERGSVSHPCKNEKEGLMRNDLRQADRQTDRQTDRHHQTKQCPHKFQPLIEVSCQQNKPSDSSTVFSFVSSNPMT